MLPARHDGDDDIFKSFKYGRVVPVFINGIYAGVANTIEFCLFLSTVYLQEFQIQWDLCQSLSPVNLQEIQIQLSCVSLYPHYICNSFKYDRVVPVFINCIFAGVSNTVEFCRCLSRVYMQDFHIQKSFASLYELYILRVSNMIEFYCCLSTVYLREFQIQ